MKPYFWTVAVELFGPRDSRVVRAVVDTGATATLMPPEVLRAIGCDPADSRERVGIVTASGREYLPQVTVPEILAIGHRIKHLQVMAHALPSSTVDGLLGMDVLLQLPDFENLGKKLKPFLV